MKRNLKKLVALAAMTAVLAGALSGCGTGSGNGDGNGSGSGNESGDLNGDLSGTAAKGGGSGEEKVTLTYYCIPDAAKVVPMKVELFQKEYPNVQVNIVELPNDASERLTTISTVLQSKDSSLDVFDMDVTWPEMFNVAGWLEPLDDVMTQEDKDGFYANALEANTYDGKLCSLPIYIDAGMLFYRSDLLEKYGYEVPKTWDEVISISKDIMEKEEGIQAGIAGSWKQFEGLVCNALEYMWAYGGDVLDESGGVMLNSQGTKEGLQKFNDIVNTHKIAAKGATSFTVTDSRVPFYSGNMVFLRDWSSAYVGAQDENNSNVAGKIDFTTMPMGSADGTNNSCLGGWEIGVSAFSKNKDVAKAFAKCVTGYEAQKLEAMINAKLPSRPAVLEDSQVKEKVPYLTRMVSISQLSKGRPKSAYYSELSSVMQQEISALLAGSQDVETTCGNMQSQVEEIVKR